MTDASLARTRDSYDAIAAVHPDLADDRPLDRTLFAAFTELVRFTGDVSVDLYRPRPDDVASLLRETGFELWTTAVREPAGSEQTTQGYILARKP